MVVKWGIGTPDNDSGISRPGPAAELVRSGSGAWLRIPANVKRSLAAIPHPANVPHQHSARARGRGDEFKGIII